MRSRQPYMADCVSAIGHGHGALMLVCCVCVRERVWECECLMSHRVSKNGHISISNRCGVKFRHHNFYVFLFHFFSLLPKFHWPVRSLVNFSPPSSSLSVSPSRYQTNWKYFIFELCETRKKKSKIRPKSPNYLNFAAVMAHSFRSFGASRLQKSVFTQMRKRK